MSTYQKALDRQAAAWDKYIQAKKKEMAALDALRVYPQYEAWLAARVKVKEADNELLLAQDTVQGKNAAMVDAASDETANNRIA